ncbi:MAG TPA: TetR/AcrR family transcriptional regulator [Thermoleophilaceae bacterium]|nr:TetR/AcrR family transcriptional regulator [Thermoleophilaceae bacterium]
MQQVAREAVGEKGLRAALIDAAARLIATEGPSALTLRRVASEVGTSTMAIYTHFGGMPELRRAVRHEGFARLADQLRRVTATDDPVADLWMLGRAYYANAVADTDLYRVAFMEQALDATDVAVGSEAFKMLVSGFERCIAAGRFDEADATALATEFWAIGHGVVALEIAQLLSPVEARACLDGAVLRSFESYGDARDAAERSRRRAERRAPSA